MGDRKSQKSTKRKNKQPPTPVKQTPSSSTQDSSKTNKNEEYKIQLLEERIIQLEKKVEMLESTLSTQAYKMVESNQQVKFVFANINGNLKLRLNQPIEHNKYTYTFDTIVDLEDLFERFG